MSTRHNATPVEPIGDWPILKIVNEGMEPTGRFSKSTIGHYRSSCKRYDQFRGSPQLACEVTLRLLEKFQQWEIDEGYSEKIAKDYTEHVAAAVRFADETLLPRKINRPYFFDKDEPGTVERVMVDEYFPCNSRIASPDTERQYAGAIARFSKFLERPATLNDLNDKTAGLWIKAMLAEGLSAHTVNGYLNKLRAFWNFCAKRKFVDEFPTIHNAPQPKRIPRCWTDTELRALLAATDKLQRTIAGVPITPWFRAFIMVAFDTGERSGALFGLRWENYNPATGELEALAESRKGGQKPMLYVVRPATMAALELIREPRRDVIFAWPQNRGTFYNRYKTLLKHAGLPYEKHRSGPQKIRRTFASYIERGGGNATVALDHSARAVTTRSYIDPRVVDAPSPNLLLPDLEAV